MRVTTDEERRSSIPDHFSAGGECQAPGQSFPQKEQDWHSVPDRHTQHLCGEPRPTAQGNMGGYHFMREMMA